MTRSRSARAPRPDRGATRIASRLIVVPALAMTIAAGALSSGAFGATPSSSDHRALTAADVTGSIVSGGLTRTYLVHVPSGTSPGARLPLLLAFHGNGGTAAGMAVMTGFDQVANANHFIVVYPQGVADSWNDGRGTTAAEAEGVDDVGFVRDLVRSLEASEPVDPHRVYATGFSNGAMLTERLGCSLGSTFAAIAMVAGPIPTPIASTCAPSRVLPALDMQGTADAVVPFSGGAVTSAVGGSVISESAVGAFWASRDRCGAVRQLGTRAAAANDGTGVTISGFGRCARGSSVILMAIVGGGHLWPGDLTPTAAPAGSAAPGSGFRASPAIWHFLAQFTRSAPA